MIKVFHDPINHDPAEYVNWLDAHQDNGYLIDRNNQGGSWGGQFHRANCPLMNQIVNRNGALQHARYKACSTDRDGLLAWGQYVHQGINAPQPHVNGPHACNP
ncbi:MAG: hypothetical protein ACHQRJ_20400 [Alphaproteobacteria bacterium]